MTRAAHIRRMPTLLAFVAVFWAGMLAGVSFLATPVKFQAGSLSLPVALEVGNVTFRAFGRLEWGLAIVLVATALVARAPRVGAGCSVLVATVVAIQSLWLLPVLDARVAAVIAGSSLPPSPHHLLYIVAEAAKLLLLCVVALTVSSHVQSAGRRTGRGTFEDASYLANRLRAQDADLSRAAPGTAVPGDRRG